MPDPPLATLPTPGSLLVALPTLEEPTFHRTVILMLAFGNAEGALGVVLNRPNEVPVEALLPGWEALAAPPDSVFVGGPVARDKIICLATLQRPIPAGSGGGDGDGDGEAEIIPGSRRSPTEGLLRRGGWRPSTSTATRPRSRTPSRPCASSRATRGGAPASWSPSSGPGRGWCCRRTTTTRSPATPTAWTRVLARQSGHVALYAKAPPSLSMN